MLSDKATSHDFWCPLGEPTEASTDNRIASSMMPADWAALSRLGVGEWLSEAQVSRLQALGLAERVFGQALLTRLGRTTLGMTE